MLCLELESCCYILNLLKTNYQLFAGYHDSLLQHNDVHSLAVAHYGLPTTLENIVVCAARVSIRLPSWPCCRPASSRYAPGPVHADCHESFCSPEVAFTGELKKSKDGFPGLRFLLSVHCRPLVAPLDFADLLLLLTYAC
uniref:(northern house mosquito) hypothetical protein n=1 Tax=Culex pipiens TaxID=7175 RepID=A0A8D8KTY9_CULPI